MAKPTETPKNFLSNGASKAKIAAISTLKILNASQPSTTVTAAPNSLLRVRPIKVTFSLKNNKSSADSFAHK